MISFMKHLGSYFYSSRVACTSLPDASDFDLLTLNGLEKALSFFKERGNGGCQGFFRWMEVKRINLHSTRSDGSSLLHIAVKIGALSVIQQLLFRDIDPNQRDGLGMSAVHLACMRGNLEALKCLKTFGADLEIQDHLGRTPLHMAVLAEDQECLEYLLLQGVDLETRDLEGRTPLHLAVLEQSYG